MQVNWGGVQICAGKGIDDVADIVLNGRRLEQQSTGLRWQQAVERDRLNTSSELQFTVTRSHGSAAAAENFMLTHKLDLDAVGIGQLTLVASDGSGKDTTVCYLLGATMPSVSIRSRGMLTTAQYTFKGGAMTTAKPPAP